MSTGYQETNRISKNGWITDPEVPDPDNLPEPLGWTLLVRPYPISQKKESAIIFTDDTMDSINHSSNIGRVVAVGPCCWTRPEHRTKDGEQKDWVEIGDFISFPRNVGAKRNFKGVSYVLLVDDEVVERLPDPQVMNEDTFTLDIPESHLKKYNTIKNPKYKKKKGTK